MKSFGKHKKNLTGIKHEKNIRIHNELPFITTKRPLKFQKPLRGKK